MAGRISPEATIPQLLRDAAARWPDRVAIESDTGGQLTYAQLDADSDRIARRLRGLGLNGAERVAVQLPNGLDYPVVWLAIMKAGMVMVPINFHAKLADASYLLAHSGARAMVCTHERIPLVQECRQAVPTLGLGLVVGPPVNQQTDLLDLDDGVDTGEPLPPVRSEDTVNIQYTSGTTGHPKGCLLNHRYWLTIADKNLDGPPGIGFDDILLTAQPFHYMDPQWNLTTAIAAGARVVIASGFHPTTFWRTVAHHRATFLYCVGVMPRLLLKMPPTPDERQHALRRVFCSGIPAAQHAMLEQRFAVPWLESYGMTETGAVLSMTPADHDAMVGAGSVGRVLPMREVEIVDGDGAPVPRGTPGELQVRGAGMMKGYFAAPEANASAFRHGWFRTGDIVTMDESGYVYLVSRRAELIRRGDENIAAAEVEQVIESHPGVRLAACVGVPDEVFGHEIKAYYVPSDPDSPPEPGELAQHCADQLAAYKVPRYWQRRDSLPMTPSQRVARGALAAESAEPVAGAVDLRPQGRADD